jgi:16S rRNA G1207 methylase RsmC
VSRQIGSAGQVRRRSAEVATVGGMGENAGVSDDHYFSAEPGTATHRREVGFTVAGRDYTLVSAGGVFSADRLDPGTAVLLRKAQLPSAETSGALLDLGCGYGPIACVLATVAPRTTVYAVDVNARARELVAENAARVGASDRVRVHAPDEVPEGLRFAQIWSNPPIRIGKAELHAMLRRWLSRLSPDGVAWLVVARHLGGDSLHQWLIGQGWAVDRHASQKGYRVLRVRRPENVMTGG